MASQVFWKGFAPGVQTSTGFPNQGKILLNPTFLGPAANYDFMNIIKTAEMPWTQSNANGILSPLDMNANGYPTTLSNGGNVNLNVSLPGTDNYDSGGGTQRYVMTWTGNGTVGFSGASTINNGSFTSAGGTGFVDFTVSSGVPGTTQYIAGIFITALGSPVIGNLALYFYADYASGAYLSNITSTKMRFRINQAKTPVFRDLNWGLGNINNVSVWADRKPTSYVCYGGDEYRSSIAITNANMTTAGTAAAYTATTTGGGGPAEKQKVMLFLNVNAISVNKESPDVNSTTANTVVWSGHPFVGGEALTFSNNPQNAGGFSLPTPLIQWATYYVVNVVAATSFQLATTPGGAAITGMVGTVGGGTVLVQIPTLNINGSGAVPIRTSLGDAQWFNSGTGHQGFETPMVTNTLYTFTYEGAYKAWYNHTGGLCNGVPPEIFISYCAELGCHPWMESPMYSCDPMTDYHVQLATYIKNNAPSWMIPRFEALNEPWNTDQPAGMLPRRMSTYYTTNNGWSGLYYVSWISRIANTIGQDLISVLGPPNGTKYHLIVNLQTGPGPDNNLMNAYDYQNFGPVQSGYNNTHNTSYYLTHVAQNRYYFSNASPQTAYAAWHGHIGNPTAQQADVDAYLDDPTNGVGIAGNPNGVPALNTSIYTVMSPWCQGFTNSAGTKILMACYEGGFVGPNAGSFSVTGDTTTQRNQFTAATKFGTNTQHWYTTDINNYLAAGGVFPAEFTMTGSDPSSDEWSVLNDIFQSPDTPQWLAIISFNH